ncbi:extracellular solute-binding protein [Pusillimonas sp. SM2304]|uniref:ABC transporter substrate-binding protein n=1 Tax=Pusillimonas sp. SM2304 TaxID=3073241 RepID=UPI002875CB4C|nr:extracellular solute-binding protein [Pusillimonas sp. SM2304]MDS1138851.1 extracellular solute-binding protein [Pusillimonas sp. SM2304]
MNKIDRRDFLKLAGAAGMVGVPGLGALAHASQVSALAKSQGKAVFYANITAVEPIMAAFEKATGIKGEYTRASSSKFVPTILTEFQAGKLQADILQSPQPMLDLLKQQGVLAPYASPSAQGYPDWATQDDSITLFGIEYVSYLFNTDHLKPSEAPARYEDLADPKWKNQIVMANPANHASTIAWLVGLKELVFKSEDEWLAFVKGLAANRPMFVASFGPTPAPVESGEKRIGISMPKYIVTKKPAPLDWGPRSGQPLLGTSRAIALTSKAPRPDAARAFIDYWLGKEAMSLLAKDVGEYVLAPGVFPEIEGIDKVEVKPVRDLSDEELQKWGREFAGIFNTR